MVARCVSLHVVVSFQQLHLSVVLVPLPVGTLPGIVVPQVVQSVAPVQLASLALATILFWVRYSTGTYTPGTYIQIAWLGSLPVLVKGVY